MVGGSVKMDKKFPNLNIFNFAKVDKAGGVVRHLSTKKLIIWRFLLNHFLTQNPTFVQQLKTKFLECLEFLEFL